MPKPLLENEPFNPAAATQAFLTAAATRTMVRKKIQQPVKWPAGLAPTVRAGFGSFSPGVKITTAVNVPTDVLIILFTNQETQALLDVFTGNDTWDATRKDQWYPYAHNFTTFAGQIGGINKKTLLANGIFGHLFPMQIGTKQILLYKTELHPKNDGNEVPFIPVIKQLVSELSPKLVITTGTAGAIGAKLNCGDVVITDTAGLHCRTKYPSLPDLNTMTNNNTHLKSKGTLNVDPTRMKFVQDNFVQLSQPGLNDCFAKFTGDSQYAFLKDPASSTIYVKGQNNLPNAQPMVIVSGDYITVDDNHNSEQLENLGSMNDTDDGFAAYAISLLPASHQPQWLSIRNASEPQITAAPFPPGTSKQKIVEGLESLAGPVYQVYQYCTTINSAFACWGVIAGI